MNQSPKKAHSEVLFHASIGPGTWADMPAALTELIGDTRQRRTVDLRNYKAWRLTVNVETAGAGTPALVGIQFSIDGGSTWRGLDNGTAGVLSTQSANISSAGHKVTTWTAMHPTARIESCLLRIVGIDGNGIADPQFRLIVLEIR